MTKGYIPQMPQKFPIKGEKYRHYKGDLYEVVGLAIHSNDDIWMVVYKPLYENADAEMFTRPLDEWFSEIEWNGNLVQRFSLI
ncbi:MAG: hypothetical protein RI935_592 [Candidatus Parcubacteria bacterium]|jgi:hypothetical protein